jgi:hypothetical protein
MPHRNTIVINALLALKAKAASGSAWTVADTKKIDRWINVPGEISVLAACCVVASDRLVRFPHALGIICDSLRCGCNSQYLELSIYEALIQVDVWQLKPYFDDVYRFINRTLAERRIDLDNTICLIGKFARVKDRRAMKLLKTLALDSNDKIRDGAVIVLHGIEEI